MREIQEDEVFFENTDENPMLIAIALVDLNQANILNI
jgi:hypothetical protein